VQESDGYGPWLGKFDVQGAFCTVLVHPVDCWLLDMQWQGWTYVGKVLPLGLRSALKIYNALADGLLWVLTSHDGVDGGIHYLDDFLLFGAPDSRQCEEALSRAPSHHTPIAESHQGCRVWNWNCADPGLVMLWAACSLAFTRVG